MTHMVREKRTVHGALRTLALCALLALGACGDDDDSSTTTSPINTMDASTQPGTDGGVSPDGATQPAQPSGPKRYVLGAVTIDADGNRVSYAQIIEKLEGHYTNRAGIEAAGNAVFLAQGNNFFYGLAERPVWVRYTNKDGRLEKNGELSFATYGIKNMTFANVVVDADNAVSVLTDSYKAVVWSPSQLRIKGEVDLGFLKRDGFEIEANTTTTYQGKVYIPVKWVNWTAGEVLQKVGLVILDPAGLKVLATAEDERCAAAGRVVFDARGYGYMMADGRNSSFQTFAAAKGKPSVPNCILRIAPNGTDFEQNYFFSVPDLAGGRDSMTEPETAALGTGQGFFLLKYEDRIPAGIDRVNFAHWSVPAYKSWRVTFGDVPKFDEVQNTEFTVVGFTGSAAGGKLYTGVSPDGAKSSVSEIDPATNSATAKFTMDGYFSALLPID